MTDAANTSLPETSGPERDDRAYATERADQPHLNWGWMMAAGVISVIGGVLAFLNPFLASLVAESLFAAAFLIGGVIAVWMAFRNEDGTTGGRLLGGISGVLAIAFAVLLWANPLEGLISLTLAVALFLLAMGAVRVWVGIRMRRVAGWGWIVASGAVTVLLGVYIFATLPQSAMSILGLFLAVELLFSGAAQIATALSARERAAPHSGEPA